MSYWLELCVQCNLIFIFSLFLNFCEIWCDLPLRLPLTFCLFNVFTVEMALETVFICFLQFGMLFYSSCKCSDLYPCGCTFRLSEAIVIYLLNDFALGHLKLSTYLCFILICVSELHKLTFSCNGFWKPVFKTECCLKAETGTCMFRRILSAPRELTVLHICRQFLAFSSFQTRSWLP